MAKDKKKPQSEKKAARSARPPEHAADTQRPAESELRFQHLIRNMVVARAQARKPHD